jgi:hypothetical protein
MVTDVAVGKLPFMEILKKKQIIIVNLISNVK